MRVVKNTSREYIKDALLSLFRQLDEADETMKQIHALGVEAYMESVNNNRTSNLHFINLGKVTLLADDWLEKAK